MKLHSLPDKWLAARVVAWMQQENEYTEDGRIKCPGWWIGVWTADGKWKETSGGDTPLEPGLLKRDYAMRICRYLNKEVNEGGAWLCGWVGERFYMIYKDGDGDIKATLDCTKPFWEIIGWSNEVWAEQAAQTISITREFHSRMDYTRNQLKKHAQGEKVSTPNVI